MHDQHTFSAQAYASMPSSVPNAQTCPVAGDELPGTVISPCPSYASTSITPALVDVATGDIYEEPVWEDNECSAGVWKDITRGDGDATRGDEAAEAMGEPASHGHGGHFGLITANWGGHWGKQYLEEHMNNDLRNLFVR